MKNVLLSHDDDIRVFSVPDRVAGHLEEYCMEFWLHWLRESPGAEKYRVKMGGVTGVIYGAEDFIDYLNQYVCNEPSTLVETLHGIWREEDLPKEYAGLPYFNF